MKLLLAVVVGLSWAASATAHPVAQGAMEVNLRAEKISVRLHVSPEQVFVANMHASFPATTLEDAYREHGEYLLRHLRLQADGEKLNGVLVHSALPQVGERTAQAIYDLEFPVSHSPATVRIEQDVLNEFDYAPGNRWEASYIVQARSGATTLLDGALLTSAAPLLISTTAHTNSSRLLGDYLRHGIAHILTGYDHLLFISALALAVTTFWELAKVIAAFTLAHTVTLTLAVLDIVRLPSHIVEPMIAASIVFVALQNVFWPGKSRGGARLSIAFFFGLFHGLGFAGGLLDAMAGMPGVAVGLAIVAFSCGVEIGHQCVVLPLFGLTKVIRAWKPRTSASAMLLRGGSALIGGAGIFYLVVALTQGESRPLGN